MTLLTLTMTVPVAHQHSSSVAHADVLRTEGDEARLPNSNNSGQLARFDVAGQALDAHDGEIKQFGDTYYLYGTSYGCGYVRLASPVTPFCGFRVYSSQDLEHWTAHAPLFDATTSTWQSRCNSATLSCYRPHVLYQAASKTYVLWVNTYDVPVDFRVLVSDSPTGPFHEVALPRLAQSYGGDFDLFADDDGSAYIAYTLRRDAYNIAVERLDDTYTSGTGVWSTLAHSRVESPSLFKRQGSYYLSLADPNCAYCSGTGSTYLRADSPLGPWIGDSSANVQQVTGKLYDQGVMGLTTAGSTWRDYDSAFTATPLRASSDSAYARAGWLFRAQDESNGYLWSIGSSPDGGTLTKSVLQKGRVVSRRTKLLSLTIDAGQPYDVDIRAQGTRITTWINGTLVDIANDSTYSSGRAGPAERQAESAYFQSPIIRDVGGTVVFSDSFSQGFSQWTFASLRRHGKPYSQDSCQGQPTDVAMIKAPSGDYNYLYMSDRWHDGDPNEALANHYWEPLAFDEIGGIQQLTCADTSMIALQGLVKSKNKALPHEGASSGSDDFNVVCDITGTAWRAQSFEAIRDGALDVVKLTAYQHGRPTAPLTVSTYAADALGHPFRLLARSDRPASRVSWAPDLVTVHPNVNLTSRHKYVLVLRSPANKSGCYGVAHAPSAPYAGGSSLSTPNSGASYISDGGSLKFALSIQPVAAPNARPPGPKP